MKEHHRPLRKLKPNLPPEIAGGLSPEEVEKTFRIHPE